MCPDMLRGEGDNFFFQVLDMVSGHGLTDMGVHVTVWRCVLTPEGSHMRRRTCQRTWMPIWAVLAGVITSRGCK